MASDSRVSCGEPYIPPHGRPNQTEYVYPHYLSYECNEGYRFAFYVNAFRCNENGLWDPVPQAQNARCDQVTCLPLQAPLHGDMMMLGEGFFRSIATFSCDEGFVLKGSRTRECLANGTWSGEMVTCESPCVDLGTKVTIVNETFPLFTVRCESGEVKTLTCANGQWSDPDPCAFSSAEPAASPTKPSPDPIPPVDPSPRMPAPVPSVFLSAYKIPLILLVLSIFGVFFLRITLWKKINKL